jgi:hypothetical protein
MTHSVQLYVAKTPEGDLVNETIADESRDSWTKVFKHLEQVDEEFSKFDDTNWEAIKRAAIRRGWKVVRAHLVEIDVNGKTWSAAIELKESNRRLLDSKQRESYLTMELRLKTEELKKSQNALKQMTTSADRAQRILADLHKRTQGVAIPRQLQQSLEIVLRNSAAS